MPDPPARRLAGPPRAAIVHDWLTGMRGGEFVLEAICELLPDAELFTLVHVRGSVSPALEARRPRPSFVSRLPAARRYYRHFLPLFPFAVEQLDLDAYDLVISSSHCAAKAVIRPGRARHLCYCHSPMRYAWDQFDAYFGPHRIGRLPSALMRPAMAAMARWDAATSGRVDCFLANSQHVAGRIRRYYNRRATVVYPPVDTDYFRPDGEAPDPYLLVVSALVPYKRLEVAIRAADAAGRPLRIVGDGPERARLSRLAGPRVEFLGRCDVHRLRGLYQRATALVQPGEEDFGMAPVEAQACGRPVIALARGGAVESVDDGVSGVLVPHPTADAFADAMARLDGMGFDAEVIRERALRFSRPTFVAGFAQALDEVMASDQPW